MSAAGKPDLVIPLKLGGLNEMIAALQKLRDQGKEAGKDLEESFDKGTKAGKGFGDFVTDFVSHQGLQLMKDAAAGMNRAFEETSQHIKEIAKDFSDLQEALRIVATFKGEKPTEEFTVETARRGAEAGLTPKQWADFEKQFTGFAGQFIGEGKKISEGQGAELEKRAASFMSARGIEASQGGAIFGEILQQAKGGETTDELMQRFGQSYAILEAAKGDPGQLLGQMGQVTAEGVDVVTGSKLMRAMAQRDPGEAGTYSRALLRGLRELRTKGKTGELGIKEGMDVFQQIEAVQRAAEASGQDQGDFLSHYFKDERTLGSMQAAINFGVKGGQFAAADADAAKITGQSDVGAVEEFKQGSLGKRLYSRAALEAARIKGGQRVVGIQDIKGEAERQLEEEGAFEDMTGAGNMFRGMAAQLGAPGVKQQLINERAVQLSYQAAGERQSGLGSLGDDQAHIDREILTELRKANAQREAQARRPLSAPAPQPTARN